MQDLLIYVKGDPPGQPRGRHVPAGKGRFRVVSTADDKVAAYRTHLEWVIRTAIKRQKWARLTGAIGAHVTLFYSTKKRDRWGRYCTNKPDRDNADKLILDVAKKAGVFRDDAQVAEGPIRKVWAREGALVVRFRDLDGELAPTEDEGDTGVLEL